MSTPDKFQWPTVFSGLQGFAWADVPREISAGITLAALIIPLNIGFTQVAGLPPVLTWLAARGVTFGLSRANQTTSALLARYQLLDMIGKDRVYPTNRHAIAAFRKETGQATP